jgi:hypothetical protein
MPTHPENDSQDELYMGFRIRQRDGIYIAVPQDWLPGSEEAIVATDLETVREEIHRWWYQVGT